MYIILVGNTYHFWLIKQFNILLYNVYSSLSFDCELNFLAPINDSQRKVFKNIEIKTISLLLNFFIPPKLVNVTPVCLWITTKRRCLHKNRKKKNMFILNKLLQQWKRQKKGKHNCLTFKWTMTIIKYIWYEICILWSGMWTIVWIEPKSMQINRITYF